MNLKRLIEQNVGDGNIRVVVIPDTASEARFGTVHMISDDTDQLEIGDRIIFGKYSGMDLAIEGDRCYLIMRMSDIYGIISETEVESLIKSIQK